MKKAAFILVLACYANLHAQIISTVAGNHTVGYSGDGAAATSAALNGPTNVAIDVFGNIYIADWSNSRIRKVNTAGIISTVAGSATASYGGDGGAATLATLNHPEGIAVDAHGNLYIADEYNSVIRKVNTNGIISTIAGSIAVGYAGDGGAATAAKLNYPTSVAVDVAGNIYIADHSNNAIRKINTASIITTIAGTTIAGYAGDGGAATLARLNQPWGVGVDNVGNVFIADFGNNVMRKVNTAGIISTFAGTTVAGYSGDGGMATAAKLNKLGGVVIDASGNVYIADDANNVIRMVNSAGLISTYAGTGTGGYMGDGGLASGAELLYPFGVALDAINNLYIADFNNNVVRKIQSGSSGIEHIINNNNVTIYPNPAQNNFTIEVSTNEKQTLQLFDVNGKQVLSQTINGITTIDASNFNAGVYNISITSNNGVTNKRLVIVR